MCLLCLYVCLVRGVDGPLRVLFAQEPEGERELELPAFEEKARPPVDFFKAIFEDKADESSDESSSEEEDEVEEKKPPPARTVKGPAGPPPASGELG
jgi:hypothetical protein